MSILTPLLIIALVIHKIFDAITIHFLILRIIRLEKKAGLTYEVG